MERKHEKSVSLRGLVTIHCADTAMEILRKLQTLFQVTINDGHRHIKESDILCVCNKGDGFYLTVINRGLIMFRKTANAEGELFVDKHETIEELMRSFLARLFHCDHCEIRVSEQTDSYHYSYKYKIKERNDQNVTMFYYDYDSRPTSSGAANGNL